MYLDEIETKITLEHHYLAHIIAEIRRANVKDPSKIEDDTFLKKWVRADDKPKQEEEGKTVEERIKQRTEIAKSGFGILRITE